MAIWKLTIEDDEGQKTVVPLVRDEYTIGRRDGHQIRLTERNVSRDHAKLRKNGDGYFLEDLGSYNGLFVNGHRVAEPQRIQPGDLILIGDFRIEAHNDDASRIPTTTPFRSPSKPPSSARTASSEVARTDKPSRFVLLTGDGGGKEFPLNKPRMIIGRGDDVDVRVNHSSVSRHHCEVHQVDTGFEVVDQASANGIRINGQDVKKALLAPGDTLELGDIQLKYVGANQAFVFDAAAAEAARELEMRSSRRRKSSAGTWLIVIALIGGAGVGGVVLAKSTTRDDSKTIVSSNPSPPTVSVPSDEVIVKALKLKETDPFAAHNQIADFAKESPLRKDPRYVEIENAWADKQLKLLETEPSDAKKREGIKAVLDSGADQSYRTSASDMLSSLEKKPTDMKTASATATSSDTSSKLVHPTAVPPASTPTIKPPPSAPPATTVKPLLTATATTTAPPVVLPTPGNCPSWKGRYDEAMRAKDYECVRTMLMPRLNSSSISSGEARYLKAACAALGDTACQKRAADKI